MHAEKTASEDKYSKNAVMMPFSIPFACQKMPSAQEKFLYLSNLSTVQ
jgi:hypothetical protein